MYLKKRLFMKIIILLFLVFSIIMSFFLFIFFNEMNDAKRKIANDNYIHWSNLLNLTIKLENNVKTIDDINHYGMYENAVIYNTTDFLIPSFKGDEASTFRFLCVSYDSLFQDLSKKLIPEQYVKQGFDLFMQMNKDLRKICEYIVNEKNYTDIMKLEIIDEKSSINKEIQLKINEFCEKYDMEIDGYYKKFN